MKKLLLCLACGIAVILMTGCENNKKLDNTNNVDMSYDINNIDQIGEYGYASTIVCEAFDKGIKYFLVKQDNSDQIKNWLVTEDNDIYIYTFYTLFSNNTNCKRVNQKFPDVAYVRKTPASFYNDEYILEFYDANYHEFEFDIDTETIEKIYYMYEDRALKTNRQYFEIMQNNGFSNYLGNNLDYAIKNNKIYGMHLEDINESYFDEDYVLAYSNVLYTPPSGETIIDYLYTPDVKLDHNEIELIDEPIKSLTPLLSKNYILTDKSYYRYAIKDASCYNYIDVECEYELKRDDELSKYRNDILYIDGSILVTKNGRIYDNMSIDYDINY